MKLIATAIFCLVITEAITGTSIPAKQPDSATANHATNNKSDTDVKIPPPETTIVPDPPSNSTNTTTTTVTPPTTTSTTPLPPHPNTTTVSPPTTPSTTTTTTTPSSKNVTTTTTAPVTTPVAPTESPAHKTDRKFDSFSFIAGIVMAAGLMAIGLVAFKFYEARRDRNYHTI